MSNTFRNAPLVELIADLRWGDALLLPTNNFINIINPAQSQIAKADSFFMQLGGELYQRGFQRSERLIPGGIPVHPTQPVYRFRSDRSDEAAMLFQAGSGIFSAHAIPPYRSWKTVKNPVQRGVEALLNARSPEDRERPFSVANLRYINAFGSNLTKGLSASAFMQDILGFTINVPNAVTRHIETGVPITPNLQFSANLPSGGKMQITVGEGLINNESRIILDMTVACPSPIQPEINSIMEAFTNARDVIHNIFIELTNPITDLLEPIGDADDN